MNVNLRQLRAFVCLARTQSFTKAAEQLHITQAGLSAMVRELEGQLNCRLFDRTTRSVALTDGGRSFLPVAERVVGELTEVASSLGEMNAIGRTRISIGSTPLVASSLIPQVCERFAALEPSVRVLISDIDRRSIQAGVESGDLDAGYGVFLKAATGLLRVPMLKIPLVVVRSGGTAAEVTASPCEWKDLTGLPFIGLPVDNPIQQLVESSLLAAGSIPSEQFRFEAIHTILAMAEAGLGVAVLPSFVRAPAQRYRVTLQKLIRPKVTCDFYEITKKGRDPNPLLAKFSACFKHVLAQVC